jgi:predicted HTH transcriptional regulator
MTGGMTVWIALHRFLRRAGWCPTSTTGVSRIISFVLEVETTRMVHANQKDEIFIRVGDEDRTLGFSQRQELVDEKGQTSFEASPAPGAALGHLRDDLLRS